MFLIMSHDRGEDDTEIHRLAWDTFVAGTEVAKRLKLYGAGQDLLADAFSGNIRGAGPGSAEMELEERPVRADDRASWPTRPRPGAFNLPLYKMFARPLQHGRPRDRRGAARGLRLRGARREGAPADHASNCPEELYDLLVFIGSPARYAIKRVVSRA